MKNLKRILMALLTNPILIIGYWFFAYELSEICRYGRSEGNIYILLLYILIFVFFAILTSIRTIKTNEYKGLINFRLWNIIAIIIVLLITAFYGFRIYKGAVNFGGKLYFFIDKVKNERTVKFERNNIYENGVEGIFQDIDKKYTLPKTLYLANNFNLKFDSNGRITSFYTFVYGKSEKGKDESFLITYDEKKSKNIKLILNGYANPSYDDDKLMEPLIETVKVIPFKDSASRLNQSELGLVYYGKRNWEGNSEGIININESGKEVPFSEISNQIIGYTVSIFIPGKEKEITPLRYNLINDSAWSKSKIPPKKDASEGEVQQTNKEEFFISQTVGYKLKVEDKAAGTSFYSLNKTTDGGNTWNIINNNPFRDGIGRVVGINFLDEKIGFLASRNASGDYGGLYRTDNGGITFAKVDFPPYKVNNGSKDSPFDCPGIPYEENGVLNILVRQGEDGDYNGHSKALYQSKDKGVTWEFVKEVKE